MTVDAPLAETVAERGGLEFVEFAFEPRRRNFQNV